MDQIMNQLFVVSCCMFERINTPLRNPLFGVIFSCTVGFLFFFNNDIIQIQSDYDYTINVF